MNLSIRVFLIVLVVLVLDRERELYLIVLLMKLMLRNWPNQYTQRLENNQEKKRRFLRGIPTVYLSTSTLTPVFTVYE